jgi:hypothetical protein
VNIGAHEYEFKRRRKWRAFLEEIMKLVQFYDDHDETKKTRI